MRRWLVGLLAVCTLVMAPTSESAAQGKKPPPQKVDPKIVEAKRLFDMGAEFYAKGSYDEAIDAWEQSYALSRKPLIFESIANAYERLGQPKKAREYLVRWRDAAPSDELELLETRIKNLDSRIAREEQQEAARKADEDRLRKDREKSGEGEEDKKPDTGPVGPGPTTPEPESTAFVPGYILAAVGAAAVVVGVTLDLVANGRRPDASTACAELKTKQLCLSSQKDSIESSNTLAIAGDVVWIAGSVTAVTGVVLAIALGKSTEPAVGAVAKPAGKNGASVTPIISPHGGGLLLRRSF